MDHQVDIDEVAHVLSELAVDIRCDDALIQKSEMQINVEQGEEIEYEISIRTYATEDANFNQLIDNLVYS